MSFIGWLLWGHSWYGPSCGEIYWGDFHGDPPDCCDPCDRCGNFTGGGYVVVPGDCGCDGGMAYEDSGTVAGVVRPAAATEVARPRQAAKP